VKSRTGALSRTSASGSQLVVEIAVEPFFAQQVAEAQKESAELAHEA